MHRPWRLGGLAEWDRKYQPHIDCWAACLWNRKCSDRTISDLNNKKLCGGWVEMMRWKLRCDGTFGTVEPSPGWTQSTRCYIDEIPLSFVSTASRQGSPQFMAGRVRGILSGGSKGRIRFLPPSCLGNTWRLSDCEFRSQLSIFSSSEAKRRQDSSAPFQPHCQTPAFA